jgi:hypothetical protein
VIVIAFVVISRTITLFERFDARSSNMEGVKATLVVLAMIVLCGELCSIATIAARFAVLLLSDQSSSAPSSSMHNASASSSPQ